MSTLSERVVIGMDPHKRSATIEVMTAEEAIVGGGRFGTDRDGYAAMLRYGRRWSDRVWAIEGCAGIGKHIANRLLADGENVVDVPPKLSARTRVFATGQGRKTDATDAHSVALVAPGWPGSGRWSTTSSSRCYGSWSIDDGRWVRTTPGWSPSCTSCCSS
jgi:transposase